MPEGVAIIAANVDAFGRKHVFLLGCRKDAGVRRCITSCAALCFANIANVSVQNGHDERGARE